MSIKYSDYQFKESTKEFIRYNKFIEPTPIQHQVIPNVKKGYDIIGISATGTGKTHAFLIPILEAVDTLKNFVQVVITAPTRELALQIYERAKPMQYADQNLRIRLITGGIEKTKMNQKLKVQPHVVIGTPGRIKDLFLNDQTLRLEQVRMLVVDEADMTLEFGFLEDVDLVASRMNDELQMLSFSATIPNGLRPFLKKYMHNPKIIKIEDAKKFKPMIEHVLIPCKHLSYEDSVIDLLPNFQPYVCLIFANTREEASNMAKKLRTNGYDAIELHGDLTSRERIKAMKRLKTMKCSYIVATDIAARGIDIEGISHVISMGFPRELDYYVHRSGRTGRNGKTGICFALYMKKDEVSVNALRKRGIEFLQKQYKNGRWIVQDQHTSKRNKNDLLEKEISKIVSKKKKKVKPGYKVKRKQEIEKLKRKARRNMIQQDIQRQKKEKAKLKQLEKRD